MTRETKVGLVVACSFLCLVGIVVASKWRNGDTTTPEPKPQENGVAAVKEGQPGKPPVAPEKKDEGRPGARPTENEAAQGPPVNSINPVRKTDAQIDQDLMNAKKPAEQAPTGIPGPFPAVTDPILPVAKDPLPAFPPAPKDPILPVAKDPLPAFPPAPKDPILPVAKDPLPAFPPAPKDPILPVAKDPLPAFPPAPKDPILPVAKDPLPAFPPAPKDPILPVAKDPLPAFPPAPKDPILPVAKDPLPAFPPAPKDPILPVAKDPTRFPPLAKDAAPMLSKDPTPAFPPIAKGPAPAFPPQSKDPIPQIPRADPPGLPPIIVKGAKPPLPAVKETMLDFYECRQGENTFTNLSMLFYGTDRYTDALKMYNRANSTMVPGGSNLTFDPPVLTTGQKVLNPPKELLERDYGSSIRAAAVAPSAIQGSAPTVKITAPTPLQPVPIRDPAPVAPPAAGASYKVQNPNGESILDIAERLLGNRSRWTTIYDLNRANPVVQPQFRIPVGTELKMPAS